MKWIKKNLVTLLLAIVALVGVGLIAYPTFSDYWNSFRQTRAVSGYNRALSKMDDDAFDDMFESAQAYNEKLGSIMWELSDEEIAEYESELDVTSTGVMCYIDIPKLDLVLPIYHGVSEAVLQVAVGHIPGTSLPVGGESTNSVLSGHRGLPSAKLFSDLDKMTEGDTWTINVLNRTLTYEVDQIRIVEPDDLSSLTITPGEDYCTLVTCTPYGINSHRLLVRGHRVANAQGSAEVVADAIQVDPNQIAPLVAGPIVIILFLLIMLLPAKKKKKKS